jgi:hypothetical protein
MYSLLPRLQSTPALTMNAPMREGGLAVICVLCALFAGCAKVAQKDASLAEYAGQFIPTDATNKVTAPGIPWEQVSFDVTRAPLEFAVNESRLHQAAADGWKLCEPATSEWTGFTDMSVAPARYTQTRTYVLYRQGVLIVLIGTYYSASEAVAVRPRDDQAEKPVQHVVVISRQATEKEALETAAHQNLRCAGGS